MTKLIKPSCDSGLPGLENLPARALPVALVLVSVELQRHWAGPFRWPYLLCVLTLAAVWLGVLAEHAMCRRLANFAIDGVIFALLFAGLWLTARDDYAAGRELLGTLLFWAPLICAWWALAYYAQPERVIMFTATLYAGLLFPHRFEGERHVYEYPILGVLVSVLVRAAIGGLPRQLRFGTSEPLARDDALRDPVSGTANRAGFEAELSHIAAVADRYREPFSLIACHIDGFAEYAERFGLAAANELQRAFAWRLGDRLRLADTLCRWADGKFFILLPNTHGDAALQVAHGIRQAGPYTALAGDAPATCSIGVCQHRFGTDPMTTFSMADTALSHAIQAGGNQLAIVPDSGMQEPHLV